MKDFYIEHLSSAQEKIINSIDLDEHEGTVLMIDELYQSMIDKETKKINKTIDSFKEVTA